MACFKYPKSESTHFLVKYSIKYILNNLHNPAFRIFFYTPSMRRLLSLTLLLALATFGLYAILRHSGQGAAPASNLLTTFTQNDVSVSLSLERPTSAQTWLVATFTPLRANFHLYSKDLPRLGLRGQGRPTLLEVLPGQSVTALGSLQDSLPTEDHYSQAIQQALPVYPAGPVTLRQQIVYSPEIIAFAVSVTYQACSQSVCLSPVVSQPLTLSLAKN